MKRQIPLLLVLTFIMAGSWKGHAQYEFDLKEFGISAGGFTNFPADKYYLDKAVSVFYVAPYVRTGQHLFTAGLLCPLRAQALCFTDKHVDPRPGFLAGYNFYLFNADNSENIYIHYAFQYIGFKGSFDINDPVYPISNPWKERDIYINNVIGIGYNLFFDSKKRFGFYYTLDYVISQASYRTENSGYTNEFWVAKFAWNYLSTHVGFSFKIIPIGKKEKK